MKTILAAMALALLPLGASAAGCSDRAAMSCPQGQAWDSATKACVIQSS